MKMTDSESVNWNRKEIKENEDQKSRRERYSENHGIVGTGIVLEIHADIRPDIFISGTTKYTVTELAELLKQEDLQEALGDLYEFMIGY